MRIAKIIAGLGVAATLAACQSVPEDMSVADYCADANKANQTVCRLNVLIDGQKVALADTDMRLDEARAVADNALNRGNQAHDLAQQALDRANAAYIREDQLSCTTRTVNKTKIGTCEPGYTVMSCTQTRYTTRAGGVSILREINEEQCRFHDRVLEMQVRCCQIAPAGEATVSAQQPLTWRSAN